MEIPDILVWKPNTVAKFVKILAFLNRLDYINFNDSHLVKKDKYL